MHTIQKGDRVILLYMANKNYRVFFIGMWGADDVARIKRLALCIAPTI
ncbi:hypothetical protein L0P62_05805 [Anaerosalibacter bizertensis]|uniref:Uncharacterized protein n=1 Tax=Anaerosalibacter bizertensis TaxID=932217 RepID=A0A9Q4AC55_9FIRM|nr:hypothetical protein [Anaerosalibacter bizertensis]